MFIRVWSIGLQKLTKIIENRVHIRSIDHFKKVGVHGRMTNEISSVDDRCVWLCIRVTFSSSIGKVLKLPDGLFLPTELNFCDQFYSFCWLWLHFCKGAS